MANEPRPTPDQMSQPLVKSNSNLLQESANKSKGQTEANLAPLTVATASSGAGSTDFGDFGQAPAFPVDTGQTLAGGNALANTTITDADSVQQRTDQIIAQQQQQPSAAKGFVQNALNTLSQRQQLEKPASYLDTLAQFGYTPESMSKQRELANTVLEYNKQIADIEARKERALIDTDRQYAGLSSALLRGEKAALQRQYNSEIAAKAAQGGLIQQQLQIERGFMQDAVNMTKQVVDNATWQYDDKVAQLDYARDTYTDIYNVLSGEEQTQWDRAYTLATGERDEKKSTLTEKINVYNNAIENGVNPGWTMSDLETMSLEELTLQVGPSIASRNLGGGGGGTIDEGPMSINQIDQFRRSYGWTPPHGFTESQLIQYQKDNPNATPAELEAGANQAIGSTGSTGTNATTFQPQANFPEVVGHIVNTMTKAEKDALFRQAKAAGATKLFRFATNDIKAYLERFEGEIEEALNEGWSKDEIKQKLLEL